MHRWTLIAFVIGAAGAADLGDGAAQAQTCVGVRQTQFIPSPLPANSGNRFGYRVAIAGDRALVAAIGQSQFGSDGGAVYALHRVGGTWSITQTLGAGQVNAGDAFGSGLAMDGDVAVIGSPLLNIASVPAVNDVGGAFVYRLVGGTWTFEQQLMAGDPNANDRFGSSVAIDGDAILVGAPNDDEGGSDDGAAYVFRHNGTNWTQEQKIFDAAPAAFGRMGLALALQGDLAAITRESQGVVLAARSGGVWSAFQTLTPPDGTSTDQFGISVDIDGSTIVAGAPEHTLPPVFNTGAAYVFTESASVWSFAQKLTASDFMATSIGSRFGSSVAVQNDAIVVGAAMKDVLPFATEPPTTDGGGIYVFRRPAATWVEDYAGAAKWRWNWGTLNDDNMNDLLGSSVAIDRGTIVAGGPRGQFGNSPSGVWGKALFFEVNPPDCDVNGMPDHCDPDCNHNAIIDACETFDDCNVNGQADECEAGFEYQSDSGVATSIWGLNTPGTFMWLNQFNVKAGGQRLTHVSIGWFGYGPGGHPGQIVVYDDVNNDGNPADAVLLAAAPVTLLDTISASGAPQTIYSIPTTYVGEPGESFFIGVVMTLPAMTYVAGVDGAPSNPNNRRLSTLTGSINGLSTGWNNNTGSGDWLVRGIGLDCNGNGVWDQCDIASGFSLDRNSNGVPDECDDTCPANTSFTDNEVNINDLLDVINNWGACPSCPPVHCPADVDPVGPPQGDCQININDLLAVINAWGACP